MGTCPRGNMKRKIYKLGKSTLVVSLPAKWTKKYNVESSQELHVLEKDRSITFSTDSEYSENEVEIDIKDLNEHLIRLYITGAYIKGYDQIKIIFEKQDDMLHAQGVINSLIGLAIIEQGTKYCVAGEVSGTTDKQFDNILRRMFLLIMSIAEDTLEALEKNDKEGLKGINLRDHDVDKFTNFCLRILNKKGYREYDKTAIMYDLIQELEELCDNYEGMAKDSINAASLKMRKELVAIYKDANDLTRVFYKLFYDFKKEDILEFYSRREKIIKDINSIQNIKAYERTILYHLRKINDDLLELLKLKVASNS
jgi:phosphate uptake regulator